MLKKTVTRIGDKPVILMDSITKTSIEDEGAIVVCASHGGASSGEFALEVPLAAVFFNDAGVGKDRAGVLALDMLQNSGIPAVAISHESARIGDSQDMWDAGIVSEVNPAAAEAGVVIGESVSQAVSRLGS